jgi:hypothetical protein
MTALGDQTSSTDFKVTQVEWANGVEPWGFAMTGSITSYGNRRKEFTQDQNFEFCYKT